jgi:signal transduction histidine kinase
MDFDLFKTLTKLPYIWQGQRHDSNSLSQNKHCQKCRTLECTSEESMIKEENICQLGFNSFVFILKTGKVVFNGLILDDNKIIKSGRKEARKEYLLSRNYIKGCIGELNEITSAIEEGIKNNIRENFTLFHDVRTSYGIAFSNLESIIFEYNGSNFSEKLQNSGQRIIDLYDSLDLVNSLLDLIDVMVNPAAIVQGSRKDINLYRLSHKLTKLFGAKAKKKSLTIDIKSENIIKDGSYHDSIKLVPIILIENAIKYSEKSSQITLKFFSDNSHLCFTISSFGKPIPEDERNKIFNKQFRGSNSESYTEEGIGMGLFIAKSILFEHNGKISCAFEEKTNGMGLNIFKVLINI